jgi:Epoxide hydrolase N terminus
MKPLDRPSNRVTFRRGTIVFAAVIVVVALSSTSARRVGPGVLVASVGDPSATGIAAENNGTLPSAAAPTRAAEDNASIRPFQFHARDDALADLRRRIAATKWPEREIVTDASQGVQLTTMRELARIGKASTTGRAYEQLDFFYKHGLSYAQEIMNRPQTLYGIEDSPVGLAAWMLDHDARSYALIARVFNGEKEGLTRDDILDNVTLYWLTNTGVSSARLYWESKLAFFSPKGIECGSRTAR